MAATNDDFALAFVLDLAPGSREVVSGAHSGTGTTRLRRLKSVPDPRFYILDWEFPPGTSEGPHRHVLDGVGLEHYFVQLGHVTVIVDGHPHELHTGDAIAVAGQSVREVRNDSAERAAVLLVVERLL
jgi:quercetin dioxygenase-like cupin family protein